MGKIWCSFGDSITKQEKWQPFVLEAFPLEHINCGLGSTTVGVPASPLITHPAYYTDERLGLGKYADTKTAVTESGISYQLLLPNTPDVVTIMGGSNDVFYAHGLGGEADIREKNVHTYVGAYAYVIETLFAHDPAVKLFLLSPVWSAPLENVPAVFSLEECTQATRQLAQRYGVPFVDVYRESGITHATRQLYHQSDAVHPNEEGGKRIAALVKKAFAAHGIL
ncbi:MAG: hypothetical protein E7408_03425 [Ruminococcaceae bacterium]|nr:hypothetical protein [Oscillospiraceae bacterium]